MINLKKLIPLLEELQKVTYDNPKVGLIFTHSIYGKFFLKLNPQRNALFGEPLDEVARFYWNNKFEKLSKEKQKERANELCSGSSSWSYVDEDRLCYLLLMDCGEWTPYDPEEEIKKQVKALDDACYKLRLTREDFLSLLKYYEPVKDKII